MNTRIEKDFFFQSAVHFENKFYINSYELSASMLVETSSLREQQVSMNRIEYFIGEFLQNSVFVDMSDALAIKKYIKAGVRVCRFPEQPYDQIVSMIVLLKLNAIAEGRIKITDLIMVSLMSDGVKYNIVSEVAEGSYGGNHWWNRSCASVEEPAGKQNDDNVVKLFDDSKWADLNLSWKKNTKNSLTLRD